MKSPSPSSVEARRGWTLLETLIATGLGLAVLAIVTQAYFAANKAKALTVGTSLLKLAGTAAISEIYKNLHQSRHLFGRGATADTFVQRLPLAPYYDGADKLVPGIEPDEFRLPDIRLKGSFWTQDAQGAPNPDFDADAVGNALFFATTEPKVGIADPPGETVQRTVFGSSRIQFATMRLHLYLLTRRPLPRGQRVRVPDDYVYQLMHLRTEPYLDYREVVDWMRQIKGYGLSNADAFIAAQLRDLAQRYPGALALDATDAAAALFDLVPTASRLDLEKNDVNRIEEAWYRTPLSYAMHESFGIPMVAFNTTGASPHPPVPVGKLDVPAYARDDAAQPYGFEVKIGGPPDRRQVLVRLALAARTSPGNVMVGETFQQVVLVADF